MRKTAIVLLSLLCASGLAFAANGASSSTASKPWVDKGSLLADVGVGWGGYRAGPSTTSPASTSPMSFPLTFGAAARAIKIRHLRRRLRLVRIRHRRLRHRSCRFRTRPSLGTRLDFPPRHLRRPRPGIRERYPGHRLLELELFLQARLRHLHFRGHKLLVQRQARGRFRIRLRRPGRLYLVRRLLLPLDDRPDPEALERMGSARIPTIFGQSAENFCHTR